jgi:hypothetical protein
VVLVQVQLEAQPQQHTAYVVGVVDSGITDGAQQDGVAGPDAVEVRVAQSHSVRRTPLGVDMVEQIEVQARSSGPVPAASMRGNQLGRVLS